VIEGDFQAPNWLDLQRLHHNPQGHRHVNGIGEGTRLNEGHANCS
jgi:hypothetical protein